MPISKPNNWIQFDQINELPFSKYDLLFFSKTYNNFSHDLTITCERWEVERERERERAAERGMEDWDDE